MSFWDTLTSALSSGANPLAAVASTTRAGIDQANQAQEVAQQAEAAARTAQQSGVRLPSGSYNFDRATGALSPIADTAPGTTPTDPAQRLQSDLEGAPAGTTGDATAAALASWQAMTDEQRLEAKQQLYYAGLYGSGKPLYTATLDEADIKAMGTATTLAVYNKTTWDKAIAERAALGEQQGFAFGQEDPTAGLDNNYQQAVTMLRQFEANNGINLTEKFIQRNAQDIATGAKGPDEVTSLLRDQYVATAYPGLADKIRAGSDVADLAAPYLGTMQNLLELPDGSIDLNDPTIQRALSSTDEKGNPTAVPLWQFKDIVKRDPRWASTDNAWSEVSQQMAPMLDAFGLG